MTSSAFNSHRAIEYYIGYVRPISDAHGSPNVVVIFGRTESSIDNAYFDAHPEEFIQENISNLSTLYLEITDSARDASRSTPSILFAFHEAPLETRDRYKDVTKWNFKSRKHKTYYIELLRDGSLFYSNI